MVHIKHITPLINIRVSSEAESMASDEALEASVLRKEALAEVTSSRSVEDSDYCYGRSGSSEDTKTASDDSKCAKVAAMAVAAGITFDFSAFGVGKVRIALMENNTCYFLKG
jgi:hypothetical protein